MIVRPIPYTLGEYVTFQDTLTADDSTESLSLTKPSGLVVDYTHSQLTRTVNPDTTVTYSVVVQLNQTGAWRGQFSATNTNANVVPVSAYVVDPNA